jgi:hypothetical protein
MVAQGNVRSGAMIGATSKTAGAARDVVKVEGMVAEKGGGKVTAVGASTGAVTKSAALKAFIDFWA